MTKALVFTLTVFLTGYVWAATIIDHTCTDLSQIPSEWIDNVQDDMISHYAHTSHGSQLTYGLMFVEQSDPAYAYEIGSCYLPTVAGAYCVFDGQESVSYVTPELYWETAAGLQLTRDVLDNNPTINTSMWCWCCQCDYYTESQVLAYLSAMTLLESEYPDVTFIYFTGNAQGTGSDGLNRYANNNVIRNYCSAHDKVLFDFADLDAWWYNPSSSQWEHHTYSYGGYDIPAEHPQFYGSAYGHTTAESCEQKGRAWWWMMAVLAGWSGTGVAESEQPAGYSFEIVSPNPSTGQVSISYSVPGDQDISIQLFNITGRLEISLAEGIHNGGDHQITADDIGPGVYFVRMTAEYYSASRMLVILN